MRRLIQRLEHQANKIATCSLFDKQTEVELLAEVAGEILGQLAGALEQLDALTGGTLKLAERDLSPALLEKLAAREKGR